MPPTRIEIDGAFASGFSVFKGLSDVRIGDLIVVSGGAFFNNGPSAAVSYTCTDTLGNDYGEGYYVAGPSFGQTIVFFCFSEFAGAPTITLTETVSRDPHLIIVQNWRDPPPFDQVSFQIGQYVPASPGTWPTGVASGDFTVADSLILSFIFDGWATAVSDSGDTLAHRQPSATTAEIYAFQRTETGPGNGYVRIKETNSNADGTMPLVVLVFSSPIARPVDLVTQQALREGAGEANTDPPQVGAAGPTGVPVGRPLTVSLPYEVGESSIGNLIVVRLAQNAYALTTLSASDEYGNTYTERIQSTGSSTIVSIYTAIIEFYPPPGEVFRVQLNVDPASATGATFQSTALGVTEWVLSGPPVSFHSAGYLSVTDNDPTVRLTTDVIPNVPKNSLLFAIAAYPGGFLQHSIDWAPVGSYVNAAETNFIQFSGQLQNRPRLGPAILMDMVAAVSGDYDAEADGTVTGAFGAQGGIALIAVVMPATLTLVKNVVGGDAAATDWTLEAVGPDTISGPGGVGPEVVTPGEYALSESAGPAGYEGPTWGFSGGTQTGPASVEVGAGEDVVATATNTYVEPPPPPPPPEPGSSGLALRYQIPTHKERPGRWFPHSYSDPVLYHYLDEPKSNTPNDQQLLMLAGDVIVKSGGNTDNGEDIVAIAQAPSSDGGDQRLQKLYVDSIVDADSLNGAGDLSVTLMYDNAVTTGPTYPLVPTAVRQQLIQNISSLVELSLYRNIAPRFAWTGGPDGPRMYAYEPAGFAQPYLSKFFVTQFISLGFTGWKHSRRCYPALISNATVVFTIKAQDGRTFVTSIPSTGGQFKVVPLMVPQNCKDLSFAFELDGGGSTFAFFPADFTVEFKEWQQPEYIHLAVFAT